MKSLMIGWVLSLALLAPLAQAAAVHDVYQFKDPAVTARFNTLTHLLRCPKCQDNSIADSQAEIAGDMRRRTAELLREGKTNKQVVAYFVARYGDFVTFRPPLRWDTALLWAGPVIALLIGLLLVIRQLVKANRRWKQFGDAAGQATADSEVEDN